MEENKIKDFVDFMEDKEAIAKPVIIDHELIGWITWSGGHTLNFWNTDFENTDIRNIGDFASDNVSYKVFLKEANEWIKDIEQELKND